MPRRLLLWGLFIVLLGPTVSTAKMKVWTYPLPLAMQPLPPRRLQEPLPANVYIFEHRHSAREGKYIPPTAASNQSPTITIGGQ